MFCLHGLRGAEISTILGTGEAGFSGDGGPATQAKMRGPFGVVRGPDGSLYVCDTYNHCMRKIDTKGIVTTVAGKGGEKGYAGDGGLATEALLNEPYEVRFDQAGNMYFVEMMNHVIRKVDAKSGKISTIAGTGKKGFSGDGGLAKTARFNRPHSIQFGPNGNLFVCDIGNHRIRKIDMKTGKISTFSGTGKKAKTKDGGKISKVDLNGPRAIATQAATHVTISGGAITGQTGLLIQGLEESGEKLWACIAKVSTSTGSQQAGNGIASLAVYFPRTSATGKTAAHASRTCIA